jgi:hypothetical protein
MMMAQPSSSKSITMPGTAYNRSIFPTRTSSIAMAAAMKRATKREVDEMPMLSSQTGVIVPPHLKRGSDVRGVERIHEERRTKTRVTTHTLSHTLTHTHAHTHTHSLSLSLSISLSDLRVLAKEASLVAELVGRRCELDNGQGCNQGQHTQTPSKLITE